MSKLNIQSIFHSLDGEANAFDGAGQLCTFIRLKGCNLNCQYPCDTPQSIPSKPENWMTIDEIVEQVVFPKVTITGGEPLLQKEGVKELCLELVEDHLISIETNGTIRPPFGHSIRYVMDYKLPSSGMEERMDPRAFSCLREIDVIKFVISDWNDYNRALEVIKEHPEWEAKKVFSPAIAVEGGINHTPQDMSVEELKKYFSVPKLLERAAGWPRQLAEKMIEDRVPAQFSLQIHKLLWPGSTEER